MEAHCDERTGLAGERMAALESRDIAAALRRWPELSGLLATAAGFLPRAAGHVRRRPHGCADTVVAYCVRGGGWCETAGRLHPVRRGDLIVLAPGLPHAYGAHVSNPWTLHWAHARGRRVADYLEALGATAGQPVLRVGEAPAAIALFSELQRDLREASGAWSAFHAAHTLGHLFSLLIQLRRRPVALASPGVRQIAQSITYMSEHFHEPLKVGTLAALAGLSPAHFSVLFKQQTGCSPHAYLHLLRMHRAAQWLTGGDLSVKTLAERLGYQDPFHFSRQFKAFSGKAPSDYRAAERRAPNSDA